jgi:CheY-like chemotaxis protein
MDDAAPDTRVLLLEDSEIDAELVSEHIGRAAGRYHIDWVHDRASFEVALRSGGHDIILADYSLPDFDGLTT